MPALPGVAALLILVPIPAPCYLHSMANLQVRNIPESLHESLRRHARENNCTISAVVVAAVERELARLEWRKRWTRRPETALGVEASTVLAEERRRRDSELDWPNTS